MTLYPDQSMTLTTREVVDGVEVWRDSATVKFVRLRKGALGSDCAEFELSVTGATRIEANGLTVQLGKTGGGK